jgi:hypothetical protein
LNKFTDASKEHGASIFILFFDMKMETRCSSEAPIDMYQILVNVIQECSLAAQLKLSATMNGRLGFWMNEKPWKFQRHVSGHTIPSNPKSAVGAVF